MSITPTADMTIDPRRAGQPVRLTPDAGAQAGVIDREGLGKTGASDDEEMSFWDLLDVINPLQHIPVVSSIYREMTGDTIRAPAKLAGGALFGGVVGLAASAVDVLLKEVSGRDAGEHVVALLDGEPDPDNPDGAEQYQFASDERSLQAEFLASALPTPPRAAAPAELSASAESAPEVQAAASAVTAADTRWFPINRDQHIRSETVAPQPVREAALHSRTPNVETPVPAAAPSSSLPLGVMSAASAGGTGAAPTDGPPPEAVRRALAAQGMAPRDDHVMLRDAVPGQTPGPAARIPLQVSPVSAPTAAPAPAPGAGGPVDVPAWFDKAMRKYSTTDRMAPDALAPALPAAVGVDRRGV
ncbi:MAG: hypothetical protein WCZ23_03950 [Rhodospirillaceae bacterium]